MDKVVLGLSGGVDSAVAAHLRAVGLSTEEDSWLWAHGPHILRQVENEELRRMDMLQG